MRRNITELGTIASALFLVLASGCIAPRGRQTLTLPRALIEPETGVICVDGAICLRQGILEYLAVASDGKAYESLFALDCRPSQLHVAMIIAGYQTGEVGPKARGDFSPEADPAAHPSPQGAPAVKPPPGEYWRDAGAQPTSVTIEIEVQGPDGMRERRPVESLLIDRSTGQSPPQLTWAFTGSFFHRDPHTGFEVFAADIDKSVIALWYDPTALLNLAHDVGNPYHGESAGLEVNTAVVPAKDTPIRLILGRTPAPTD